MGAVAARQATLAFRRGHTEGDEDVPSRGDGTGVADKPGDGRTEPEIVEQRLEGSRRRLLDAPVLVLLCLYLEDLDAYPDAARQRNETTMAVQSLGAAAQNALLAAYSLGLDTSWMCAPLFCPEKVALALGLDPKLVPHALLTLGYAEADPPKRRTRRPLDELVVYQTESISGVFRGRTVERGAAAGDAAYLQDHGLQLLGEHLLAVVGPAAREMFSFMSVPPRSLQPASRHSFAPSVPIFTQETCTLCM
jgi:hypothetical protein